MNSTSYCGMTPTFKGFTTDQENDIRASLDIVSQTETGKATLQKIVSLGVTNILFHPFREKLEVFADLGFPEDLQMKPWLDKCPGMTAGGMLGEHSIWANVPLITGCAKKNGDPLSERFLEVVCFELGNTSRTKEAQEVMKALPTTGKVEWIKMGEANERETLAIALKIAQEVLNLNKTDEQQKLFPDEVIKKRLQYMPTYDQWPEWVQKPDEHGLVHEKFYELMWDRNRYVQANRRCSVS